MLHVKGNIGGVLSSKIGNPWIAVLVLLISVNSWSSEIIQEYSFAQPDIQNIKIDGKIYDRIIMAGAPNSGKIGHPALPAYGARILMPYGTIVKKIEIGVGEKILIGTDHFIEPVEKPFVLSSYPDGIDSVVPDPTIYSRATPIPESKYEEVGIQYFRGHGILLLRLYPVEYIPTTGTLFYFKSMSIRITTEQPRKALPVLRDVPADIHDIKKWIDNPSELVTYSSAGKACGAGYDMLIITLSDFVSSFQPLKEYHDSTGISTEIHTLDMIGASDPHTIRDYIRQEYLGNGIQYVLIGADDNFIPALDMYVVSWEGTGAIAEYDMPGDIYFSCLDGTFNYDNDAFWGEPTDGEDGGDIDLFPDVNVGRFTAGSSSEISNLVNKTLAYLTSESPYLQRILLSGEQLGFGGMGEYGGYAMDEMIDFSDAHGFLTFAFPSDEYEIEKLYDVLSTPFNYWPASDIIARINSGVHIIDHLGHSNNGYAMRTDTSMIRNQLSNTEYCFVYAEGCNAGKFDIANCWAEYMTTKLTHGAFGCVANSRVGLGSRSTAHPVHIFNREFWDAVYSGEEAKPEIGRALSETRIDHAYHINDPGIRWNFYEINLFGDPAAAIKSVQSLAISYPDGIPEKIPPYGETSFNVLASGIGTGSPAPGSGRLYYSIDDGELEMVDMVELSPNLYEASLPSVGCSRTVDFYFSVEENGGEPYYSPNPATPFTFSPVTDSIIIWEDDFETDKGWSISGGLWQRGIPAGQGGQELQYPVPDPTEGCNGPRVFGYNLNGDYENNLPETFITSPAIDCSGRDNVTLKFCRWLGVEQPVYDKASLLISNNGTNWVEAWSNYAVIADLNWQHVEYDISNIAASRETVYLRWVMGPTDAGLRYIGWNIDDVQIVSYVCQGFLCGDVNGDESINMLDIIYLISFLYKNGPEPDPIQLADVNSDYSTNMLDILHMISFQYKGGPEPVCP
jgi:hypothetical protein